MSHASVLLLSLLFSSVASAEPDVSTYASAFGATSAATAEDSPAAAGSDALEALRDLGSFPVRVRRGDGGKGWTDPERRVYEPKRVERHYKAGRCEFTVRTGEFTLRKYVRGQRDELIISKDPIARFSTLQTAGDAVLVSVNTEIYADVAKDRRQACKDLFGGHRVRLGTIDLAQTALTADGGGPALAAKPVGPSPDTTVWLHWDSAKGTLALEDAAGMAPAVESAVFNVQPQTAGDYYLAVTPSLGVQRSGKR